eukprot:TRINITY_DN48344_c0_g1_i1.p1 TRINITY_DN48344_c0_g1~~TRINITY_DN48344_c0_g1_i1.p1  ORF type:complete len:403 (-),score=60.71 TRINITY_DN48344_c0_g1_i1:69-1277(-)
MPFWWIRRASRSLCYPMDRFVIRKSVGTAVVPDAKRPRTEEAVEATETCAVRDPRTIVSWNVNGLAPQLKNNWSLIQAFLKKEQPDVLCLQEVRLSAAGPRGCKKGDGQRRRRNEAKQETAAEREEWSVVQRTLLAEIRNDYVVYWSLADSKYSGTALIVRKTLRPSRLTYTLPAFKKSSHSSHLDPADPSWHPEGRIILASFESFDLLATYAPNNGNDESSFARRAAWDEALLTEFRERTRPLVWMGDVNCAAEDIDASHPGWMKQQCNQGGPPETRGQPGLTLGERQRFREILQHGRLVDAYRRLHPASVPPPANGPYYTWRGHPPVNHPVAKYHGKGMRIDCSLVAEELFSRVEAADILGQGAERTGFMGSDHSPIRLTLAAGNTKGEVVPPSEVVDLS